MTRSPKYPIAALPDGQQREPEERHQAPADFHDAPGFRFRHELREPLENAETSYRRAHPELYRAESPRARRWRARRGG
jgi:hypothetical protein